MEAQWGMAPAAPPPPSYEPATDPMYAPAPELSYQQPYVPPAPDPGYGADSAIYAPAPNAYAPASAPAPDNSYAIPMQDPWAQMAYAPAQQLAYSPTYQDMGIDPSMGQQFGWDTTGSPESQQSAPFFNNPQFAESNAQFDATTDPNNRNPASVLGGLWNFSNDALKAGQNVIGDTAQQAGNYMNPFGWNAPTASGYAGGRSRENNVLGDIARFGAETQVPGSVPDLALLALSDPAFEALGAGYKALRNPAAREGLGDFAGRLPSVLENPAALGGDLVNIPRSAPASIAANFPFGTGGGGAADDAAKFLDEVIRTNPGKVADGIQAARMAGISDSQIIDTLSTNANAAKGVVDPVGEAARNFVRSQTDEVPATPIEDLKGALRKDLGITPRTPEQIAETVAKGEVPEGTVWGTVEDAIRAQGKSPTDEAVQYLTDAPSAGVQAGLPGTEAGVTAKQAQILAQAQDNIIAKTARDAEVAGIYEKFRPFTYKLTGDVADSRIASVLNMEDNLRQALRSTGMADEQMNVILKEWRDQALPRIFKGKRLTDAKNFLKELNKSIPKNNAYDAISQALKESTLSLDVAIFGQNVEAAIRRGALPIATGVMKDTAQRIATRLHLPGMVQSTALNELDQVAKWQLRGIQFGAKSSAGIEEGASIYGKIPGVGKKVEAGLNKLTDWQYGDVMGLIKLRAAQGLEAQYRFLDGITLGKFNLNPDDPKNWQRIADYVNTIGSTAARATNPGRAKLEARTLLSATMTRAQINEVLLAVKAIRSPADMVNLVNYLGSTASLLGAGWALNDQFGVGDFTTNALDSSYGKIVSKAKDETGRYRVFDITPQYSFEKLLAREIAALKGKDWSAASEAAQRFGFGRANIPIGTAARALGKGYGTQGSFEPIESKDTLPVGQRIQASVPVPLSLQQMVQPGYEKLAQGDVAGAVKAVADPINLLSSGLGQTEYPENTYSARDRAAQDAMGKPFDELNVVQQAQVYAKMAAEGAPIEDYNRRKPYEDARDAAYQKVAASDFGEAFVAKYPTYDKLRDEVVKRMLAKGWDETDITDEADKFIKNDLGLDFEQQTHDIRISIVQNDPGIVPSLVNPSDEVKKIYRDSKAGK